jgi:hypothetical protein
MAFATAILAFGQVAWAKPKGIALYVEGVDAGAVRDELATALPEGTTLVEQTGFAEALVAQGQSGPFGKKLDGATHDASIKRIRSAALSSGAAAVLVGRVTKGKGGDRVHLLLVDASGDEQALTDVVLDLKADAHDDGQMASTVKPALEKYKTVEAPAPAPSGTAAAAVATEPGAPEADTSSPRPTGLEARSLFEFELGGAAAGRSFSYNDGLSNNLRSYSVLPAAMITVHAQVFPFAGFHLNGFASVIRDIGFIGAFSQSLFLQSSVSGGANISTSDTSYLAGLRVRIHPWGDEGTVFGISDAYASQSFGFGTITTMALANEVPDVAYSANRTAVDARIPLGKFAFLADFGFRAVVGAGDVAERFRFPSVEGIDLSFGGSFTIVRGWEARLIADYERYFYSFSPVPAGNGMAASAYVAGGALDQFFGARLAVAWIY